MDGGQRLAVAINDHLLSGAGKTGQYVKHWEPRAYTKNKTQSDYKGPCKDHNLT